MLPLVLYAMAGVNPVQLGHVVPTGATEYLPAAQGVHTVLAVTVQPAAFLDVPAGHTAQAEHDVALAADHVLPATQPVQMALDVGVHVALR